MLTCFRYQLRFSFQGMLMVLAVTLVIIFGNQFSPNGFFQAYYSGWTTGLFLVAILVSLSYTSSLFQIGLSFGANRQDYFWASQLTALCFTLVSAGSLAMMQVMPVPQLEDGYEFLASNLLAVPLPPYCALFFALFSLGSLLGCLMMKHRKLTLLILMVLSVSSISGLMFYVASEQVFSWVGPLFWGLCIATILIANTFLYRQLSRGEVVI